MKTIFKKVFLMLSVLIIAVSCMAVTGNAASYYESESNDSFDTADTITVGNSISGTINQSGDSDYYKITAPSNGKISISFGHTYSDYDSWKCWDVRIYQYANGTYNELSYKKIYSSDNEKINFPYIGAVKNGVYYIKVCNGSNYGYIVGEDYKISTSFTQSEYYEKENNGSYSTANKLTLGKTYGGTINKGGDNDYYKITAPSNGKISISFGHTYSDYDSWKCWDVRIYQYANGTYNELSYKKIYSSNNEKINFPYIGAVKNGVYYIKVCDGSNYGYIVGEDYKISTSFTQSEYYEKENNGSYSTANKLTLGKTYSGTINKGGDNDYYKIVSPIKSTISVKFQHNQNDYDSYKYWKVWIYQYANGSYNELSYKEIYSSDSATISFPNIGAKKNGVYYIKVYGRNGEIAGENYKITASVYLSTPKLKAANTDKGTRVSWDKVSNASGYYVYRKDSSGKWQKIATTSSTGYTDTNVKAGKTYTYTVKAYYGSSVSGYNKSGVSVKRLLTPKLTGVTSAKSGVTVKWGKVTGASGYYVYRKTGSGGWKRIATVSGNSKVSYLDKSAKKGTTYTYTVRAYSGKSTSSYNTTGLKIKDKY